jgi:hypothetical protein
VIFQLSFPFPFSFVPFLFRLHFLCSPFDFFELNNSVEGGLNELSVLFFFFFPSIFVYVCVNPRGFSVPSAAIRFFFITNLACS